MFLTQKQIIKLRCFGGIIIGLGVILVIIFVTEAHLRAKSQERENSENTKVISTTTEKIVTTKSTVLKNSYDSILVLRTNSSTVISSLINIQ